MRVFVCIMYMIMYVCLHVGLLSVSSVCVLHLYL